MRKRAATYATALFMLASFAAIGCNGNGDASGAGLSGLTGPSAFAVASVTAEPATMAPEFQSTSGCRGQAPFGVRLHVCIRARHDVFIRGIGFEFFDRSGRRVLPSAFPTQTIDVKDSIQPAIPLPTSPAIPLPTSPAIPFPGQVPMSDVLVRAGAFSKFPFRLHFDCGVPARGTLYVAVAAADRRGASDVSRISARIGE